MPADTARRRLHPCPRDESYKALLYCELSKMAPRDGTYAAREILLLAGVAGSLARAFSMA